jgi:hypothetical protein
MAQMKYKLSSYDFTREWEKDAKIKTGLTKRKLLQEVESVLDSSQAPMIKIEPWRDK